VVAIYLVACVGLKRAEPSPAQDFYCSPWFVKARRYVEGRSGRWFILSAKYGLVPPEARLAPYDLTLSTMPAEGRRTWSRTVLADLERLLVAGDLVTFLAGTRYREGLEPGLRARGVDIKIPMAGLGIGLQLQWLNESMRGSELCH
jgi:hypothetical protein